MAIDRKRVVSLYENRYGFTDIGMIFKVSRQYIHQIITGYRSLSTRTNGGVGELLAGKRCAMCGKVAINFHHIDKNAQNNSPLNLLPLCGTCHKIIHVGGNYRIKLKMVWSRSFPYCVRCHSAKHKHTAHGICRSCYRVKQDRKRKYKTYLV